MLPPNPVVEPEDLDLQRYVRAVLRRFWVAIIVAAAVITVFLVWSSAKERLTTSSITLQVSDPSKIHPLMRSTSAGQELLAIRSVALINQAEQKIGAGSTSLDLVGSRQPLGTDFVEISLTSQFSKGAFARLKVYADTFRSARREQVAAEAEPVRKIIDGQRAVAERQADDLRSQIRAIDANKPNATPLGQALAERLGAIAALESTRENLDFFVKEGPVNLAFQSDVPVPEGSSLLSRLIPGIVVGLLAGLLAALGLDLMLDRISSRRELERTLLSVHILGESPTPMLSESLAWTVASALAVQASDRGIRRVLVAGTVKPGQVRAAAEAVRAHLGDGSVEVVASDFTADDIRLGREVLDCGGYILIVSARSTSRRSLVAVVSRLQEVQRPLLGVVLVGVRRIDRSAASRVLALT